MYFLFRCGNVHGSYIIPYGKSFENQQTIDKTATALIIFAELFYFIMKKRVLINKNISLRKYVHCVLVRTSAK